MSSLSPDHASDSVQSCAEWLADILRDRVVRGEYKPGQHIREGALQREFGLSNGPVREALHTIVADGLAWRPQRRGVRIVALSEEEVIQLFEVRLALFEAAVVLAAKRGPREILEQADALHADLRSLSSDLLAGFHPSFSGRLSQWILRAAGNPKLTSMWESIVRQSLVYVNASLERSAGRPAMQHTHELIDAIVARNAVAARAIARHLTQQSLIDLGLSPDALVAFADP